MDLVARYGPFVLGALAAAVLGAYTMRSSGRPSVGRTLVTYAIGLAIFIVADMLTGQALTRPELGWVTVVSVALFGLAVIVAIAVLARGTRPRS